MGKALLKYYEAFVDEPNNYCNLIKSALVECFSMAYSKLRRV